MRLTEAMLIDYLREQRHLDDVGPDTALFSDGTIDSVGMIDLITFIETTDDFEVGQADVTLENFDTVNLILAYVRSKVDE